MANVNNVSTCAKRFVESIDFRMTSKRCCKCFLVTFLMTAVMIIYISETQDEQGNGEGYIGISLSGVSIMNYIMPPLNIRSSLSLTNRTKANSKEAVRFLTQKSKTMKIDSRHSENPLRKLSNFTNRAIPTFTLKQGLGGFIHNSSRNSRQQISKGQGVERGNLTQVVNGDNNASPQEYNVNFTNNTYEVTYSTRTINYSTETINHNIILSRQGIIVSNGVKNGETESIDNLNVQNKFNSKVVKQNENNEMMGNRTSKESKTLKLNKLNYFGVHELVINNSSDGFEPFCAAESNRQKYLIWPESPTDFTDWSFTKRRKCPKFVIHDKIANTPRTKFSLYCDMGRAELLPSKSTSSNDVDVIRLNNTCLYKFINACCSNDRGVPNVVHYVWYFKKAMKFDTFLSILSVVRFVRPCLILFHGEYIPYGNYWDYIIRLFPYVIHVNTPRPLTISGKKIHHHEHSGDVMRIYALMLYGGIYLDTDVIVLQELKPLRHYDVTMCRQTGGQFLLNSFIMTKKNATFLRLWLEGYNSDYRNESYVYNSMYYNNDLSRKYPNLIHVENGTMCCPDELIGVNLQSPMIYEWTRLYGFHIYSRQINFPWNVDLIRNFTTTLGSMLRHVVYGNKELCL